MKLFDPFSIRGALIKNRFVRAATWLGAASPDGFVSDIQVARFEELARGGCGLILTGFAFISPEGSMLPGMLGIEDDSRIPSLKQLTDAVHAAETDTRIFCQLVHTGIFRLPIVRNTYADTFAADDTTDPFLEMGGTGETCPAATPEQIQAVIHRWATAAARCKAAGFDGVELHFAHGFGPGAWFSPLFNRRTDDWGGSRENRARYGIHVTRAVRSAVGDWPVIAKINCEDGQPGGTTVEDATYFGVQLVEAGIDGLEVSGGSPLGGSEFSPSRLVHRGRATGNCREGYFAQGAAAVRGALNPTLAGRIPVISVGGWRSPVIMNGHLGHSCDAFALSRPLIHEPGLIASWREDPMRHTGCTSCNKCLTGPRPIVCRKDE